MSCGSIAAALAKRAMNLTYVGGTWGGARRPTPFLCLLLKMLMIQPEMEIVEAFISEKDFRYVRLLGIFYLRLVGTGEEVYKGLEALYSDNRKFKMRNLDGSFSIEYIDNFVDQLLTTSRVCDTTLPPLVLRKVLVERKILGKRKSMLDHLMIEDEEEKEIQSAKEYSPRRGRSERSPQRRRYDSDSEDDYRRKREDNSPQGRGRRSERSPPRDSSPERSVSNKRSGFRSPSPDYPPSRETRGARSPDAPPSATRGNRSPDAPRRRSERSPERSYRDSYRDDDDRYHTKKRNRRYDSDEDEEDDEYNRYGRSSDSKRPKYSSGASSSSSNYHSNQPAKKAASGAGGGLREMSTEQMNELRKSIGLAPLKPKT